MSKDNLTTTIAPQYLTVEGLVRAFYESYDDDSNYNTREIAKLIRDKDEEGLMDNHPMTVLDARDELSIDE